MVHSKTVKNYNWTTKELSREIVSLDYDWQLELFKCLMKDFYIDSSNDINNLWHPQVGEFLANISKWLREILTNDMEPLANLCRSYNEKWIN